MVWVSWKYSDNIAAVRNVNVAVAAYVGNQARLKLDEYLSEFWESVLYCDSVIFIQNVDPQKRTGDFLGHLTDELAEIGALSFIEEFVRWTKSMRFFLCTSTGERTTKWNVKGITLNYENIKFLNFTTMRDMNLKDNALVHVHYPKKIKRKHGGAVSEPETKEYKVVLNKRRLIYNFDSLPYGFY